MRAGWKTPLFLVKIALSLKTRSKNIGLKLRKKGHFFIIFNGFLFERADVFIKTFTLSKLTKTWFSSKENFQPAVVDATLPKWQSHWDWSTSKITDCERERHGETAVLDTQERSHCLNVYPCSCPCFSLSSCGLLSKLKSYLKKPSVLKYFNAFLITLWKW